MMNLAVFLHHHHDTFPSFSDLLIDWNSYSIFNISNNSINYNFNIMDFVTIKLHFCSNLLTSPSILTFVYPDFRIC